MIAVSSFRSHGINHDTSEDGGSGKSQNIISGTREWLQQVREAGRAGLRRR